jgi:hypothetical protein
MVAVVAAVVRCGHAFSGSATASVVDDVGGGRDGAPRPFSYRAVMIVRARGSDRFSTVGPVCHRRTASPVVNAHGARGFRERGSPRSINRERGREESPTSSLSICCPCLSPLLLGCAPPCSCLCSFRSRAAASLALALTRNGPAPANRSAGPPAMDSVDSDGVRSA